MMMRSLSLLSPVGLACAWLLCHDIRSTAAANSYTCPYQDVLTGSTFNASSLSGVWYEIANTLNERAATPNECACGSLRVSLPSSLSETNQQQGGGGGGQCSAFEQDVDYPGNDLSNTRQNDPNKCCDDCKTLDGCTTFVWTNWENGTCWLKKAKETKTTAQGAVSASVLASDGGGGGGSNSSSGGGDSRKATASIDRACVDPSTSSLILKQGNVTFPLTDSVGALLVSYPAGGADQEAAIDQERQSLFPGGANVLVLASGGEAGSEYLVLGSPCFFSAQILSRKPDVDDATYEAARATLESYGYPLTTIQLQRSNQSSDLCGSYRDIWQNVQPVTASP